MCHKGHHTSIRNNGPQRVLHITGEQGVVYPVILVLVNGLKYRALRSGNWTTTAEHEIWDIITRNRIPPITMVGYLKQVFLQIRVRESERDVLRFHWLEDKDKYNIGIYRFTRVTIGLNQSPLLLGGTIDHHLSNEEKINMKTVE